jgi:hypothetical protein
MSTREPRKARIARSASAYERPGHKGDLREHTLFIQEALQTFAGAQVVEHSWKSGVLASSQKIA